MYVGGSIASLQQPKVTLLISGANDTPDSEVRLEVSQCKKLAKVSCMSSQIT